MQLRSEVYAVRNYKQSTGKLTPGMQSSLRRTCSWGGRVEVEVDAEDT